MAINPIELEGTLRGETLLYDFDEVCEQTDDPVGETRTDIVARLIKNEGMYSEQKIIDAKLGVDEAVKDVLIYGDVACSRAVFLSAVEGGVAVHAFDELDTERKHIDKFGDDPDHNKFGELILRRLYGEDYKVINDDGIFERHLFLACDGAEYKYPKIHHGV